MLTRRDFSIAFLAAMAAPAKDSLDLRNAPWDIVPVDGGPRPDGLTLSASGQATSAVRG
jgi:hypothetical protein